MAVTAYGVRAMSLDAPYVDLDDLIARVRDGCMLAVPKDDDGVAMAATRALIRRGVKGLHLICLPVSGLQADLLIGAGCVETIECSGVSLGELGFAPRFRDAVESGKVRIKDATCQAIFAAIQASEKGQPFVPLRGLIGSDVLGHRDDWKTVQNPFADDADPIVVLPAIRPDVALFHAPLGDRHGNVWVGNARVCVQLAHASHTSLATVEEIVNGNLMDDARTVAGTIAPLYVEALAHVPNGARPLALAGRYAEDAEHIGDYAKAARSDDGFRAYLERHVLGETVPA